MNKDKFIKMKVKDLLNHYRLSKVTLDNLIYIIEDQGFEIIEFSSGNDIYSNQLLNHLDLIDYAKASNTFTYQYGSAKFVFICEELSASEKLCALAHEIGHICLSHLKNGNIFNSVEEEYDANEFAHYLLHPGYITIIKGWITERKTAALITVSLLLAISIGTVVIAQINNNDAQYTKYYITESGKKYHKKDCFYIKYRPNVKQMNKEDFESGKYKPCKICLPNE